MALPPGFEEEKSASVPEGFQLEQAPQSWADKLGIENAPARALLDLIEGGAAGAASTVYHGGDLLRRAAGAERIIDRPDVQQAMRAPDSIPGTLGKLGEQTAEFLIPGMGVTKAVKGAPLLGRMAAEAALAGGVTGVQTGGDPRAIAQNALVGGAVSGVMGALPSASIGGQTAPGLLRSSAEKEYAQVLNATKQGNKWISQNVAVPELIDRGVRALTLKGLLKKSTNTVETLGQAIDDAWRGLPPGTTAELDPIVSAMKQSATDALTIPKPGGGVQPVTGLAEHALRQVDGLGEILRNAAEVNPVTGKLEVGVENLRKLRQAWDKVAKNAGKFEGANLADTASGEIHAMGSNAIREKLAQDFPDIAAINKEFSFWKNVNKVVSDTVLRKEGQAPSLTKQIAGLAGAVGGGAKGGVHGALLGQKAMGALQDFMQSAAWRTSSAVLKDRLAKQIMSNNQQGVLFTVGQMMKAAGRETLTPAAPTSQYAPALSQ
jgi:hypothetical protein